MTQGGAAADFVSDLRGKPTRSRIVVSPPTASITGPMATVPGTTAKGGAGSAWGEGSAPVAFGAFDPAFPGIYPA